MTYQEAKRIVNQSMKENNVHLDWYEWQSIYEVLSENDEDDSDADYAREKASEMYHNEELNDDLL